LSPLVRNGKAVFIFCNAFPLSFFSE
jgi:hypothetical protein